MVRKEVYIKIYAEKPSRQKFYMYVSEKVFHQGLLTPWNLLVRIKLSEKSDTSIFRVRRKFVELSS